MPWPDAYTASDKCPVLEMGLAIRDLDSLCTYVYALENLGFIDTHVHNTCTCGDHARIQDYNDGTHCKCTTNYGFTHVSFV